jgi:hypothetical protein
MDIKYSYYVSSKGFKTVGGTAAQFLKADGSVDNNSYVTINTAQNLIAQKTFTQSPVIPDGTAGNHAVNVNQLNKYIPLTGGEITGTLTIKPSNSGSVFEQDVITFHDLGPGPSNIIPLAFKYGISTTSTAFIKAVSKGLNGVDGALFQFFDNSTKHTEISSVGVTSNSFVKSGGFSTQFLKANGSVDATVYTPIANVGGAAKSTLTFVSPSYSTTGILRLNLGTNSYAGYLKIKLTGSYASANVNGYIEVTGGLGATSTAIWNNSLKCITSIGVTRSAFYIDPIVKRDAVDGQCYIEIHKKSAANNQIFVEVESRSITTTSPIVLSSTFDVSATVTPLTNEVTLEGSITAQSFNKIGGLPAQFLKADGSVDSNSYLTQAILNTQLANYATLNGVQTFTNTKTFLQSPIVPNATLLPHAVNFGQMSNAIEESEGNTIGYVSGNFQTLNTPQNVGATKSYTSPFPFKFKTAGTKTWVLHKPNGNSFIFAPSATLDSEDWDWINQISFDEDGSVTANKLKVRGGLSTQIMMADGSTSTDFVTTNTAQSIRGYKTFEDGAELLLKGDDQNLIQSFKSSNNYGGHLVAGWYYRHYSAIWQTGIIRDAGDLSEGFGFDLSENGGSTFNRIFKIQADGNLVTNNFGLASEWKEAHGWGNHAQAGYVKLDNNGKISAKGIIHPDYPNDNNLAFMADGGIRDINDFAGTLVKYIEIQAGASFTPSTDDEHLDVYARGDMELYLDSLVHTQGKKITVYTNNNLSTEVKVYRDGNLVTTIQSGRTTEFILTFTGWIMTEIGTSTFI